MLDHGLEFFGRIELQPERDAEPVAERGREQACPGSGGDEGEGREIDPDRARGRALADDQVEHMVLHCGIEDLLHGRRQAMDLVDEQDVAGFEVGQDGREVAGPCSG